MHKFNLSQVLACAGLTVLSLTACGDQHPESIFPAKAKTQILLRPAEANEELRIVHLADDNVTRLSADVELTNGHTRKVHYENNVLASSEEFFPLAKGESAPKLYLKRVYETDGRNLRSEERHRQDGSIDLIGERLPAGTYSRSFLSAGGAESKHQILTKSGDLQSQEVYWESGLLKERTTTNLNMNLTMIDTFDETGIIVMSTTKDKYGWTDKKTIYYPGSTQIRMVSDKSGYTSKVTYYRLDGSIEQRWTRGEQTIQIEFVDVHGATMYRQNLLHYRMRLGAPAKLSDWRVFSVDEFDKSGNLKRTILFDERTGLPKTVLLYEKHATVENFQGTIKQYRDDGTLATVLHHASGGKETVKALHRSSEKIREVFNPAYTIMPTEDYSVAPAQPHYMDMY